MRLYFPICQATGRERTKVNFLIYSNSIYFSSFKYLIILQCSSHSLPFQYIFNILVYIDIVVTMKKDIYDVDFPCKRLKVIIEQIVPDIVLRWKSQKIDKVILVIAVVLICLVAAGMIAAFLISS